MFVKHTTRSQATGVKSTTGCKCNRHVTVCLCCTTNHPNALWLKTIIIISLMNPCVGNSDSTAESAYLYMQCLGPRLGDLKAGAKPDNRAHWASVLLSHGVLSLGPHQPPPSMMISRYLRTPRANTFCQETRSEKLGQTFRTGPKHWQSITSGIFYKPRHTGALGGDCSQWESVQESVDIFTLPWGPWASPWFLHSPIPQLLIWTITELYIFACEKIN